MDAGGHLLSYLMHMMVGDLSAQGIALTLPKVAQDRLAWRQLIEAVHI